MRNVSQIEDAEESQPRHADLARPEISILIPCYNEEAFIAATLSSLVDQYVLDRCEILVIDGMSTDRTPEMLRQLQAQYPNLFVLENPARLQAAGLNAGLEAARGEIIVRADAHSTYPPHYVRTCVELLKRSGAANVGGVMSPRGGSAFEDAVAAAMSHPIGIGGAKFHVGNFTGPVDTVYLGTFWKTVFQRVGPYDPAAHPAEDAELNLRILKMNEAVFLDSSVRVRYQPRSTFQSLTRQFFWYGRGRCYVVQKHRRLYSIGRIAPPLLVLVLAGTSLAAVLMDPRWALVPLGYLLSLFAVSSFVTGSPRRLPRSLLLTAVLAVMHVSYGAGFLARLLRLVN